MGGDADSSVVVRELVDDPVGAHSPSCGDRRQQGWGVDQQMRPPKNERW